MTGDRHVRSCERRGVRLPPPTHPAAVIAWSLANRMRERLLCAPSRPRHLDTVVTGMETSTKC